MQFKLTANLTEVRIEYQKMQRIEARATRRSTIKQMAFIRRNAMHRQLKRRKGSSTPPNPPYHHSRDRYASLKNIRFSYDDTTRTGVVGPLGFTQRAYAVRAQNAVPGTLEAGGKVTYSEELLGDRWTLQRRSRRSGKKTKKRKRTVNFKPRPFMFAAAKAVEAEGSLSKPWKGAFSE